jgi:hypothetical protein
MPVSSPSPQSTAFYRALAALVERRACGVRTMVCLADRIDRTAGWVTKLRERPPKREDFAAVLAVFAADQDACRALVAARMEDELPPEWRGRITVDGQLAMPADLKPEVAEMMRELPDFVASRPEMGSWLLQWFRSMTGYGGIGGPAVGRASSLRVSESGEVEIG